MLWCLSHLRCTAKANGAVSPCIFFLPRDYETAVLPILFFQLTLRPLHKLLSFLT